MNAFNFIDWIAILRRYPFSALCGAVCIVCGLASWYIYGNMKWLDLEHKQLAQDGDLMMGTLITGPSIRTELEAIRDVTRRLDDNLVVEDNLAENLWYFYKIEQQTKAHLLELHQLNPLNSDSRTLYRLIPYTLRVSGNYDQTAAFLYAIETGPRLANVTTLTLRRLEPNGTAVVLELNVELLGKK